MKKISKKELKNILEKHKRWLMNEKDGKRANLSYTDLSNADLNYAELQYADLNHANLDKANLYHANLQFSELRFANLTNAELSNADLSGANLEFANLTQAKLPKQIIQIGPIGSRKSYTIINIDDDIIHCGCWKGNTEEFKNRINETYPDDGEYRTQYLAVLQLIESLKAK